METTRLPSIFIKDPDEIFAKFKKPLFLIVVISVFLLRAWQFGNVSGGFQIDFALGGMFIVELFIFVSFFLIGGKNLSQLTRFSVLYLAFVGNVSMLYLDRVRKLSVMFEIRDDCTNGRFKNAVALWFPNVSRVLLLLVPFVILLIMSVTMNEKEGEKKAIKRWHIIALIACVVLALLTLPLANLTNICVYLMQLLLVCIIWDLWEKIRLRKSLEPIVMVSWAEIALFVALYLEGIASIFGL